MLASSIKGTINTYMYHNRRGKWRANDIQGLGQMTTVKQITIPITPFYMSSANLFDLIQESWVNPLNYESDDCP